MTAGDAVVVREATPQEDDVIVGLWQACGLTRPWNDPERDLARKRRDSPWGLLVAERGGDVVGTVMAGYDGHRGSIFYLAVRPDAQRAGVGSALMDAAERLLVARGCPKINLLVRPENTAVLSFYARRGYAVPPAGDQAILVGLRLEQDGPAPELS